MIAVAFIVLVIVDFALIAIAAVCVASITIDEIFDEEDGR